MVIANPKTYVTDRPTHLNICAMLWKQLSIDKASLSNYLFTDYVR